ncbi:YceI family protein [bacterium]|nr:YceI family protein [bacterium]
MKARLIALLLVFGAMATMSSTASAAEYKIDPVHSSVVFRIRHMSAAPVFGRFNTKSGTINFDKQNPGNSSIEITVDPASVDTGNTKRDEHVSSPDFLSVKEFPSMSFKSTSVSMESNNLWKVEGNLTVKGVTKPITLDVKYSQGEGAEGVVIHGFYTEFTIRRRDFNITSFDDKALGNEVTLYIGIEAK